MQITRRIVTYERSQDALAANNFGQNVLLTHIYIKWYDPHHWNKISPPSQKRIQRLLDTSKASFADSGLYWFKIEYEFKG
jgi:hypothetical protein